VSFVQSARAPGATGETAAGYGGPERTVRVDNLLAVAAIRRRARSGRAAGAPRQPPRAGRQQVIHHAL